MCDVYTYTHVYTACKFICSYVFKLLAIVVWDFRSGPQFISSPLSFRQQPMFVRGAVLETRQRRFGTSNVFFRPCTTKRLRARPQPLHPQPPKPQPKIHQIPCAQPPADAKDEPKDVPESCCKPGPFWKALLFARTARHPVFVDLHGSASGY